MLLFPQSGSEILIASFFLGFGKMHLARLFGVSRKAVTEHWPKVGLSGVHWLRILGAQVSAHQIPRRAS